MPIPLKIFNPSSVPEFDVEKVRAQRYDHIEALVVLVFADFLDCEVDELLTRKCRRIQELPDVMKVVDSAEDSADQPHSPSVSGALACEGAPNMGVSQNSDFSDCTDQRCHSSSQC
jgi:hypothetical protein